MARPNDGGPPMGAVVPGHIKADPIKYVSGKVDPTGHQVASLLQPISPDEPIAVTRYQHTRLDGQ